GGAAFLKRRTWDLSSGEKRLVQAVATLLPPASLVILDEPTCGVDERRKKALGRMIRERATRGPVLLASQDSVWLNQIHAYTNALDEDAGKIASLSKKTD